ncbi:PAS domain-containing protein [Pontiella sp.]|uniref:PAS domain-containing protein n=1 Tax=Pontiella sp. TaxID=2837462 RepID=UPI003564E685
MTAFRGFRIRNVALLVMLAVILPLSGIASFSIYILHRNEVYRHIDEQLETAATFAHQTLGADYHNGIHDRDSISPEEFDRIVARHNLLCRELGLEYIWSLMELDGKLVFTSSTSPDKTVANGKHAGFLELHTNPEFYTDALQTMETRYQNISDKWGNIRAVLIPHRDAHGRKYLVGASKKLTELQALTPFLIQSTVTVAVIFLIPGILLSAYFAHRLSRPIRRLALFAQEIGKGRYEVQLEPSGIVELDVLTQEFTSMKDSFADTLRELEKIMNIVAQSPILIYQVKADPDMTTEFISDNYRLMGYDMEHLRNGTIKWGDLIPAEDLERVDEIVAQSLAKGSDAHTTELRMKWADGTYHWYKCWNRFLRDESGEIASVQGIMTEVTDVHEAHERGIKYQNRLRALTQDLLQAEDRERRQLAMALHDDIGQMLAALNMKFSVLKETEDPAAAEALVPQVDELISRIMQTTKSLTWEISPTSLYEMDIAAGLERMAEEIHDLFGLETRIDAAGPRIFLDKNTCAIIFRCAKELLVNIAKHAGVKKASVGISHYGDKAHLVVSDTGRGFQVEELEESSKKSYGLFSIKERIEHLGGSMRIETSPQKGTKIMLIIPIDVEETLN